MINQTFLIHCNHHKNQNFCLGCGLLLSQAIAHKVTLNQVKTNLSFQARSTGRKSGTRRPWSTATSSYRSLSADSRQSRHYGGVDPQSLIGHSLRLQDWLSERNVKSVQVCGYLGQWAYYVVFMGFITENNGVGRVPDFGAGGPRFKSWPSRILFLCVHGHETLACNPNCFSWPRSYGEVACDRPASYPESNGMLLRPCWINSMVRVPQLFKIGAHVPQTQQNLIFNTVHFYCKCMFEFCVENFQNLEKSMSYAFSIGHVGELNEQNQFARGTRTTQLILHGLTSCFLKCWHELG
jgi:hypothetical protein